MNHSERQKILFVDDEESILEIALEFFQHKGYQVYTANNGREALALIHSEAIDCCFTDINMPEMDGLELAEHIRTFDNTIPVIVMTGYPSMDNTLRTLKNGVVDFLIKPVNLNQMELCVQRVLRERQLFVENILLKKEVAHKQRLEKLNRELLYKVEELHVLNKIMRNFNTISQSTDVFKRVIDLTLEITPAEDSRFYVINEGLQKPVIIARAGASPGPGSRPENSAGRVPAAAAEEAAIETLILESVADEVPLLVAENRGARGLAEDIRSFVAVPLKIREKVFGVLTAMVRSAGPRFNEKDLYYLSFMTQNAAYAVENLALYENIYENLFSTLFAFVKAIEARDQYTQQHSNRVTGIAIAIGKQMGCTTEEIGILNLAGQLHDIGKIGIPDDILLKPGRLTPEEFETIKGHSLIGASIVGQLGLWDREQRIIRSHHERFDGTGYPDGLVGEQIPLLARILSIADVYDAMASDRTYRRRMAESRILEIIQESAGSQFDPAIVGVFMQLHREGKIAGQEWEAAQYADGHPSPPLSLSA
ncbi:MAG TPA: HD domain-containing phosphohydrolase [Desulfobacterales bacterium]|jgi:putative nucleotidyltransferase with HDIG domain|nr:HD domain-containing phosphohydrolase [Desulfobacterales bacterium]